MTHEERDYISVIYNIKEKTQKDWENRVNKEIQAWDEERQQENLSWYEFITLKRKELHSPKSNKPKIIISLLVLGLLVFLLMLRGY